jgi:two-component system response regulator (stage 0 sporulation protein F)
MLQARANSTKPTVLVVDDSAAMRRYLKVLLELESFAVETASNGAEALQRLRGGCSPVLVLLDLEMPVMGGLETLRHLMKVRRDSKVIVCSGADDPEQVRQAKLLGAQAYLTKPVQHLYLSAAVERCLGVSSTSNADSGTLPFPSPSTASVDESG